MTDQPTTPPPSYRAFLGEPQCADPGCYCRESNRIAAAQAIAARAPEPTTDPRAAQIEAVRDVMGWQPGDRIRDPLAAELVDAMHAAGRDGQGEREPEAWNITAWRCACHPDVIWGIGGNIGPTLNAGDGPRRWYGIGDWTGTLAAGGREFATVDDLRAAHGPLTPIGVDNVAAVLADLAKAERERDSLARRCAARFEEAERLRTSIATIEARYKLALAERNEAQRDRDQGEARGWAKAVAALRDLSRYSRWHAEQLATGRRWETHARHVAADYLEAVGPDGAADNGRDGQRAEAAP